MLKLIAIGDVHTCYRELWAALRAAGCVTRQGEPTPPLLQGRYQVVLMGDLLHPKTRGEYAALAGVDDFDFGDPEQLLAVARAQVRELERIRALAAALPGRLHILLGNHDDAVLRRSFVLGTGGGLTHKEFEPTLGGVHFPQHLRGWFGSFLRELRVGSLQFAHVGPLPGMAQFDDLFYSNHDHKRWWTETPEYAEMARLSFGVYGHTAVSGVQVFGAGNATVAMVDALPHRQYLELLVDPEREHPVRGHSVREF